MIGPALTRVLVARARSSQLRLVGIAAGVTVGVALLLLVYAGAMGTEARMKRAAWIDPSLLHAPSLSPDKPGLDRDQLALAASTDHYRDRLIHVVLVAVAPSSDATLPGVARIPSPGEYVASPALAARIDEAPADQLGNRYGRRIATIGSAGLDGPDALVVVVGTTVPGLLASREDAVVADKITGHEYANSGYRLLATIGAIGVLIPVLLLIGIVTHLGSAQRAERFAVLRLIGATSGEVASVAAVETAAASAVGALLGVGLYASSIPLAAQIRVGSGVFYQRDLAVAPVVATTVVLAVTFSAAAVAWWSARRAGPDPLGASRERREQRPRLVRLVPAAAGMLSLLLTSRASDTNASPMIAVGLIGGFVVTALSLLWAGPLLTWWGARGGARLARTASHVVALGRIREHPRSTFRAVAGLIAAVFLVTVFSVGATAADQKPHLGNDRRELAGAALIGVLGDTPHDQLAAARSRIARTNGVVAEAIGHEVAGSGEPAFAFDRADAGKLGIPVPDRAGPVVVGLGYFVGTDSGPRAGGRVVTNGRALWIVVTDAHAASVERARTGIATSGLPQITPPATGAENAGSANSGLDTEFAAIAYTATLISAVLAAVTLLVSTIASVLERRRVLGLLRLTGMPRRTLRGIVAVETALPVATMFAGAIALGVFTAWTLVSGASGGRRQIALPAPGYYLVLALCLALLLTAIAAAVVTAARVTDSTSTRFE